MSSVTMNVCQKCGTVVPLTTDEKLCNKCSVLTTDNTFNVEIFGYYPTSDSNLPSICKIQLYEGYDNNIFFKTNIDIIYRKRIGG